MTAEVSHARWLAGDQEMLRRVREFDWASTPLGPIQGWSASLRAAAAAVLHSRQPMFLWWGPELIQIYNDAYVPSFGVGKHPAALGQRGADCWPEIWPIIGPQIEAVMKEGIPSWHEDALVPIFRDGAIQDVYWTYGYSAVFDDAGNIAGTLVVCTETTSRIAAQAEVERQRSRLFEFFRQVPAGICIFRGEALHFEFANAEYEDFVGKGSLAGHTLLSAMPELEGQGFDELLRSVLRTGKPVHGNEVPIQQDRGGVGIIQERYYTYSYNPFHDDGGKISGVIALVLDVTERVLQRRHAEELSKRLLASEQAARHAAEQASRAKDDFLTTASHELRTPLNAILGWANMLRTHALTPEAFERATESIERNARAQVRLIEDILDGSRIITGNLRLDLEPLELTRLLNVAVDSVRASAEAKQIELTVSLEPTTARVLGDAERMQQVVWNLVNNAIKFTPEGGKVQVSLVRAESTIELVVSDTGEGIKPEFLPHLFERFRQAEGGSTRRHGGLGLGLALVHHLVEAHGGSVRAESAGLGLGSRFTVTLPAPAQDSDASGSRARISPTDATLGRSALTGLTALVVDDDDDARDLVATVLRTRGAEVLDACSGEAALDLLRASTPSVLVSDIGMPGMDGYELIRAVRSRLGAAGRAMPAIAVTAYSREEDRRLAADAGFNAHLAKPVEPSELVRIIARMAMRS